MVYHGLHVSSYYEWWERYVEYRRIFNELTLCLLINSIFKGVIRILYNKPALLYFNFFSLTLRLRRNLVFRTLNTKFSWLWSRLPGWSWRTWSVCQSRLLVDSQSSKTAQRWPWKGTISVSAGTGRRYV